MAIAQARPIPIAAAVITTILPSSLTELSSFQLSNLINGWINQPFPNFGIYYFLRASPYFSPG
jgi:hypothetical protein